MNESGMSSLTIQVHLVSPGVESHDYQLPEGTTLADFLRSLATLEFQRPDGVIVADLLRESAASTTDRAVYVDGRPLAESVPLHAGAVVMIVPKPGIPAGNEPWRSTIPAFRDEALFGEYSEILRARRREDDADEDAGG